MMRGVSMRTLNSSLFNRYLMKVPVLVVVQTNTLLDAGYKAAKSLFSPSPMKKGKSIHYASPVREVTKMHAYDRVPSRENILSMSVDITPIPKRLVFA